MFSFSFTYTDVDTLFKLIIEHCLMSKSKLDMWPALATLKSVVFKKRGAVSGIQGQSSDVLAPGLLTNLLCAESNFSSAPHKPHSKVD